MATISTSINTSSNIDMDQPRLVQFNSQLTGASQGLVATGTNFSWLSFFPIALPVRSTDIDIFGTGFTYSGSGNTRELATGTISRISIDISNDSGSETRGDLVITGTEGLIVSNIDKDDPRTFWNEVLKGDDVFLLSGLAAADIGVSFSTIFGDDLASDTSPTPGVISDRGGNDTIVGADNNFDFYGDVFDIVGFNSGEFGFFPAEYDGGNDTILSAITTHHVRMSGDARYVGQSGILHGGDDLLDNSKSAGGGDTIGDALRVMQGGVVYGGNDTISTSTPGSSGTLLTGSGDVGAMDDGTLVGGNDIITASGGGAYLYGEAVTAGGGGTPSHVTIDGGDDTITGSALNDEVVGEVGDVSDAIVLLTGGDDRIFGLGGNDRIYGEFGPHDPTVGSLTVSGGNDLLAGGDGDDVIFGQTGNDRLNGGNGKDLIVGGDGRDVMTGGADADKFRFDGITESAMGTAHDVIRDFTLRVDKIDLRFIDAIPGGSDDAFEFVGTGRFTDIGQVRVVANNGNTLVQLNIAAGGGAESEILLSGVSAADFRESSFLL